MYILLKGRFALNERVRQMESGILIKEPTPWRRILLEKLIFTQPVKKIPTFYGTRRFIAVFTTARHRSLS
jgi:hypothetical protein